MNTLSTIKHEILRAITFFGTGIILCSVAYAAISWPSAPAGETTGGKYSTMLVPSGAIIAFNLATCPNGWKVADGSASTPDLRGEFIRGLDLGRNVDAGRIIGTYQKPSIVIGDYWIHNQNISLRWLPDARADYGWEDPAKNGYPTWTANSGYGWAPMTTSSMAWVDINTLGSVRPRNLAFLYCIKN